MLFSSLKLVLGGYKARNSMGKALKFLGSCHMELESGATQVLAQILKIVLFLKLLLYFGYKLYPPQRPVVFAEGLFSSGISSN